MRSAGNDCVVIFLRQMRAQRARPRRWRTWGRLVLWTRGGKLSRIEFHIDRAVAIRAAGLEE